MLWHVERKDRDRITCRELQHSKGSFFKSSHACKCQSGVEICWILFSSGSKHFHDVYFYMPAVSLWGKLIFSLVFVIEKNWFKFFFGFTFSFWRGVYANFVMLLWNWFECAQQAVHVNTACTLVGNFSSSKCVFHKHTENEVWNMCGPQALACIHHRKCYEFLVRIICTLPLVMKLYHV